MARRIIVLSLALVALWALDRFITSREVARRHGSLRVGRLVSSEEAKQLQGRVAALRIEVGDRSWTYTRSGGAWRCLDYWLAPADGAAVDGLVGQLFSAEGIVQSVDAALAREYGIGTAETRRVSLLGEPDRSGSVGDPLHVVDLGGSIPGHDGCYARRAGETSVWAVDSSPLPFEAIPSDGRPPLLDPSVVPSGWPGGERRIARIDVAKPGGSYSLELRQQELTDEEMRDGRSPQRWFLIASGDGGGVDVAPLEGGNEQLTSAWAQFVRRAPWVEVLDPRLHSTLGFDKPSAVLVLKPDEGDLLALRFVQAGDDGSVIAANPLTSTLYRLSPQVAELLMPHPAMFAGDPKQNPWTPYLR